MTRTWMVLVLVLAAGCFGGSGVAPGGASNGAAGSGSTPPPSGSMDPGRGEAGTGSGVIGDPTGMVAGTGGGGSTPGVGVPGACSLPREPGPCEAAIPRYYFDTVSGLCMMFNYGGCDGNDNNFASLDLCKQTCGVSADPGTGTACPSLEEYCKLVCAGEPAPTGGPSCPVPRCDCNAFVPQPTDPICLLARDSGPCDAAFARWGYNTETGKCELFSYGGCEGNANNFESEEACGAACGGDPGVPASCDSGVPLDPSVMCEGTIAMKLCFTDAKEACACLGCPDTCEILESWPQTARCP